MREGTFGWQYPPGVTGRERQIAGDAEDVIHCPTCTEPTTIGSTCEQCGAELDPDVVEALVEDEAEGDAF